MEIEKLISLIIPSDKQRDILELKKLFESKDFESLFNQYDTKLGLSYSFEDVEEFIEAVDDEEIDLETLIVFYMVSEGVMLQLDWSGEEEEGQVEEFVNNILANIYGQRFTISVEEVYNMFNEDSISGKRNIKRGKHLPILFKYINNILKDYGYKLINFDINSDQYFIGVFKSEVIETVLREQFNSINIIDVDSIK